MTGDRREFKATEGLLRDVMRKQSGSLEKAVLEGVMNLVDAGASKGDIELTQYKLTISDNGKGMSEDEIETYFEQFGYKDSDINQKDFGKFRMGRGQLFNFGVNKWYTGDNLLVVNLNDDETQVEVNGEVVTADTSGLSYSLFKLDEEVDGTRVEIDLYDEVDDVPKQVNEIGTLIRYISWLHDVDIRLNGGPVDDEMEYDYELEDCFISLNENEAQGRAKVYNQGAFVDEIEVAPIEGEIVTKQDLDLNFARNDILEGCEVWESVSTAYKNASIRQLLESDPLSLGQTKWVCNNYQNLAIEESVVMEKEMFPAVGGGSYSIAQLEGGAIAFASPRNSLAEKAQENGDAIILDSNYEDIVASVVENSSFVEFGDVLDQGMKFEMQEVKEENLRPNKQENLDALRHGIRAINGGIRVVPGFSQHRECWQDHNGNIFIDKRQLDREREEIATEVFMMVAKEACYDEDTRDDPRASFSEKNRMWRRADNYGKAQLEVLNY